MVTTQGHYMLPNHNQFIEAIYQKTMVRIEYFSKPDQGVVNRECAPLDYGKVEGNANGLNCYWVWDYACPPEMNPLALVPEQIVKLYILGKTFDVAALGLSNRSWLISRDWSIRPDSRTSASRDASTTTTPLVRHSSIPV
jgi:hypothetical protein